MNDDQDIEVGPDHVQVMPQCRGRSVGVVIGLVLLAFLATGSAYLWLNYGSLARATAATDGSENVPAIGRSVDAVSQTDFEEFKRQSAESVRTITAKLDAQKDDLKGLSDQLTALSSKLDALQTASTNTAAIPATSPPETATMAMPPTVARKPVVAAQRRKLVASKPPGRISVGGAPLSGTPN